MEIKTYISNSEINDIGNRISLAIGNRDMQHTEFLLCQLFGYFKNENLDSENPAYLINVMNTLYCDYCQIFGDHAEKKYFVSIDGKWELR